MALGYQHFTAQQDDITTRRLCHVVHLDEEWRDRVICTVVDPGPRAVCPAFGVDLVALARHAVWAKRRRREQDRALAVVLVAGVGGLLLAGALGSVVVGLAAVAVAVAAAWAAVFVRLRADGRAALRAWDAKGAVRDAAPPLEADTERRLDELNGRSNVLVYATGEGDPFIGSGRRLSDLHLPPLDIKPAKGEAFTPFDAVELHHYLGKCFEEKTDPSVHVRNRLYVRGDQVQSVHGLVPDKHRSPEPVVDSDWVKAGAQGSAQHARTYLSVEKQISGGDLVVCLLVRAQVEGGLLHIERLVYFLPPLRHRFRAKQDFVNGGMLLVTLSAAWDAAVEALPRLVGRPTRHSRRDWFGDRQRKAHRKARRLIDAGRGHDYGARTSVREAVAAYDTREHFDDADVRQIAQRLHHQLIGHVERFLRDHGVEIDEFSKRVQNITNNITYDIGNLQAGNAVVGGQGNIIDGHGQVNNAAGQRAPAASGT
ncbi:hypothetical protein ACQEU3_25285 [Spirillospora sp. CA-253888]